MHITEVFSQILWARCYEGANITWKLKWECIEKCAFDELRIPIKRKCLIKGLSSLDFGKIYIVCIRPVFFKDCSCWNLKLSFHILTEAVPECSVPPVLCTCMLKHPSTKTKKYFELCCSSLAPHTSAIHSPMFVSLTKTTSRPAGPVSSNINRPHLVMMVLTG